MKTLSQIFAIARTEFRFALRRGAPVVITVVIGVLISAGILINTGSNLFNVDVQMEQFTPDQLSRLAQNGITPAVWQHLARGSYADLTAMNTVGAWGYLYLGFILLPLAAAGAVPADRQFGVFELLRSTPVRGSTYLAGKVLGVVGIVIFIALFPFLLYLAVLEGIMLKYIGSGIPLRLLLLYIKVSLLDGLPTLACAAALGVLAGTASRNRRRAILPGFIAGIFGFFAWLSAFRFPRSSASGVDVAAYSVFQNYQSLQLDILNKIFDRSTTPHSFEFNLVGIGLPAVGVAHILIMYLSLLLAFVGLFLLARLWLRHKDNFK